VYLGKNGKYKFYSLELQNHSDKKLQNIAKACERVEQEVWNACEDFLSYMKRQSALIYAKKDKEVVAFALFDIWTKNNSLVFSANECMVLKAHQGQGLPTLFMAIVVSHMRKINRAKKSKRPYNSASFVSSTVNFKLMESFKRYGWIASKDSFSPDAEIKEIAKDYVKKENWKSLPENLFFVEAAFPNAVKLKASIQRPDYVPKSFLSERGDALLYVCRIKRLKLLGVMSFLVRMKYGFRFSKNILNISKLVRENVIYTSAKV
jgi:hypothetical protein